MSFHPNIDMWVLGFAMLFLFSSVWLKSDTTRLSFGRTRGSKLLDLRYVVQQKNKKFEHPMFCRFHPFLPKLSTSVDLQKNAAFGPEMTDAWISLFQIARSIAGNLSLTCKSVDAFWPNIAPRSQYCWYCVGEQKRNSQMWENILLIFVHMWVKIFISHLQREVIDFLRMTR